MVKMEDKMRILRKYGIMIFIASIIYYIYIMSFISVFQHELGLSTENGDNRYTEELFLYVMKISFISTGVPKSLMPFLTEYSSNQ